MAGWLLQIGGFIASFWVNQANKRSSVPHAPLGILVFVLGTQQPINAFFRFVGALQSVLRCDAGSLTCVCCCFCCCFRSWLVF